MTPKVRQVAIGDSRRRALQPGRVVLGWSAVPPAVQTAAHWLRPRESALRLARRTASIAPACRPTKLAENACGLACIKNGPRPRAAGTNGRVSREDTKFPARKRIDSTTEPPAPTHQAHRTRQVRQPPIDRKPARRLCHPVATPSSPPPL